MDSSELVGVKIEWITPLDQRNYDNLVEGVDFTIASQYALCSQSDGSAIDFTGAPNAENLEWLLRIDGLDVGKDPQIYRRTIVSRPTTEKSVDFPNYSIWKTDFIYDRRENSEIIDVIKQLESNANANVQSEGDINKTNMKWYDVQIALSRNIPLTTDQQAVYNRVVEISNRATMNADNAKSLIALVNQGLTPDITLGWQNDNITPQANFYNEV